MPNIEWWHMVLGLAAVASGLWMRIASVIRQNAVRDEITKRDIADLKAEVKEMKSELKAGSGNFKELRDDIHEIKAWQSTQKETLEWIKRTLEKNGGK